MVKFKKIAIESMHSKILLLKIYINRKGGKNIIPDVQFINTNH